MSANQHQDVTAPGFSGLKPTDLVYPLPLPAANDFTQHSSQTSFGYDRTDEVIDPVTHKVIGHEHRKHAAVDLEAPNGTPVLAMADGVVLLVSNHFRKGTGSIEVQHPGLGIVRYCEVDIQKLGLVHVSMRVKRGQVLGFLGRRTDGSRTMLHLELFSDWHRADLNGRDYLTHHERPPYERRDDLRDPTALLREGLMVTGIRHVTLPKVPAPPANLTTWVQLQHLLGNICVKITCSASEK